MKVVHIQAYPNTGGASKACFRLHQSLIDQEVQSKILMLSDHEHVENYYRHYETQSAAENFLDKALRKITFILRISKEWKVKRIKKRHLRLSQPKFTNEVITFSSSNYDITTHPMYHEADIIHLHWVSGGFIDYETFFNRCKKPVVWTLHDMNPFTGGCHFSAGCESFKYSCNDCHFFDDLFSKGLIENEFKRKIKGLKSFEKLHIASPSKFLEEFSASSAILRKFPHSRIPYGIDTNTFKHREKTEIKKSLGLPLDQDVLLFVAAHNIYHKRKGLNYLIEALKNMKSRPFLCTVGPIPQSKNEDLEMHHFGMISDEVQLAKTYAAADLFVAPSIEDNLPNTVIEALMSGTPVVAFKIGGMPDMIQNGENGQLVDEIKAEALLKGIEKALDTHFDPVQISQKSHDKFSLENQANEYLKVYKQMLATG